MGELAAAWVRPESGPVTAVGSAAIDRTPQAVKSWAVRAFGEDDKLVLQVGIVATLALCAALAGLLALRHRWIAAAAAGGFGLVGAAATGGAVHGYRLLLTVVPVDGVVR
ncbi:hypothetical protein I3F58_21630, partial [Streptomyces sp. MUM 203J]|nr:hypothetical protein [Streptomyces sp. MUM 203J]